MLSKDSIPGFNFNEYCVELHVEHFTRNFVTFLLEKIQLTKRPSRLSKRLLIVPFLEKAMPKTRRPLLSVYALNKIDGLLDVSRQSGALAFRVILINIYNHTCVFEMPIPHFA